jgi:hypothetical protein
MQKVKSGNVEMSFSDIDQLFMNILQGAIPNTEKIISAEIDQIYDAAKEAWPVRKPIVRQLKDGNVRTIKVSKGSKDKLEKGMRLEGDQLVFFIRNNAPYAWAIKVGVDTDLPYSRGTRVANELIWKPMRNSTNRVVTSLSKELTQSAKG